MQENSKENRKIMGVWNTAERFDGLLLEEEFADQMQRVVEPYLAQSRITGVMKNGGVRRYYELYALENARGTVVISYGFTESCTKYHELIYYLLKSGFQCAIMDHRGHGQSGREGKDPNVIHVNKFTDYLQDLHIFVNGLQDGGRGWERDDRFTLCRPMYLYGHSMGGCISAGYLEQYPEDFNRAILNAPMLGLKLGGCPAWAAALLCDINILLGRSGARLFYQKEFDPEEPFQGSSAGSRARYDYYHAIRCSTPAYQTSSASYRWAREAIRAGRKACRKREAQKVKIPVLVFQAGEDALVRDSAQRLFQRRICNGVLVRVPGARHEIYRSGNGILSPYIAMVIHFFADNC